MKRGVTGFTTAAALALMFIVIGSQDTAAQSSPSALASNCMVRCSNAQSGCEERCGAGKAAGPCLQRCADAAERCSENCSSVESCGKEFKACIPSASTDDDKEACRSAYRACKGTGP